MDGSDGIELEHIGLDLNIETASSMYIMMTLAQEAALTRIHQIASIRETEELSKEEEEKAQETVEISQAVLSDIEILKPKVRDIMLELDPEKPKKIITHVDPAKAKLYAKFNKS